MTGEPHRHGTLAASSLVAAFLAAAFLAAIFIPGAMQLGVELGRSERPAIVNLFRKPPTEANLRDLERQLDDACLISPRIRPWMQYAQFVALGDCGDKAVMGRKGWFFYRPELQYLIERWPTRRPQSEVADDPFSAIVSFRDQLAARGIQLLVVPAPNKLSVYPQMLAERVRPGRQAVNPHTRELLARLKGAGVEVVDLFELYASAQSQTLATDSAALYLAQDTHWSPQGVELAAHATAQELLRRGWLRRGTVNYDVKPIEVRRHGDVLRMMRIPQLESQLAPEQMTCSQVVRRDNGQPYRDDPASPLLVLGDSFLRIYQRDEPRSAGWIAHLARELGFPVASVVNDGGASTLVRQELYRKPKLLAGKRVVIWEFVERDIRFGTEGWQDIPLR